METTEEEVKMISENRLVRLEQRIKTAIRIINELNRDLETVVGLLGGLYDERFEIDSHFHNIDDEVNSV